VVDDSATATSSALSTVIVETDRTVGVSVVIVIGTTADLASMFVVVLPPSEEALTMLELGRKLGLELELELELGLELGLVLVLGPEVELNALVVVELVW
jgi:hypothetical protein